MTGAESVRRARKLCALARRPGLLRWLFHGVAPTVEHYEALRRLPIATVLDVGANKGQFSALSRHLWPTATIHAFEPLDKEARGMASLFSSDPRCHVHHTALADAAGESTFHVSSSRASSSLLGIGPQQVEIWPQTAEAETITVKVERIDRLLDVEEILRPCLLKLDVQGAELLVLDGADGLFKAIDHVYLEVSFVELYIGQDLFPEIFSRMAACNYEIANIAELTHDRLGRLVQANVLFSRPRASWT